MSGFSTATISHTFTNPDGTPAAGSLTFQLTQRMTNGTTSVFPSEITANLNSSGQLSVELTANNDTGTIPTTAQWVVTIRLQGYSYSTEQYVITVPTGGGSVDLGTLLPQQAIGG